MDLEDKETSCIQQACQALRWTFISLFTCSILFLIGFLFLRTIRIPIQSVSVNSNDPKLWAAYSYGSKQFLLVENAFGKNVFVDNWASLEVTMDATIAVWLIAFVCFIGWIFFLLYASIGIAALPIDLYLDFKRRPTLMKPISYSKAKKQMAERAEQLGSMGESLKLTFRKMTADEKKKTKRERKKATIRLQQQTLLLERDWEELKLCEQSKYMDPT
jgi:hypothetical protein